MRDQANLPQIRPAFGITATATDPLAGIAIPHRWFDGTTQWEVTAGGAATPVSGGGSGATFAARAKTSGALEGAPTYANGALGVGATLTRGSNGALPAQGGVALAVGDILLVDSQVASEHNGLYTVTSLGSAGSRWVLTRLIGFNTAATIRDGSLVTVQEGTFAGQLYEQTGTVTTVGTSAVTFDQPSMVMLLDEAQTNTARKQFADATLEQRNAAGTFGTTLASAALAARTHTFPDESGTPALTARTITAGAGLTGGGDLSANRTLDVGVHADGGLIAAADALQLGRVAGATAPASGATDAIYGITRLSPAPAVADTPIAVGTNRSVATGAGLTGGGDLTANRTIAIGYAGGAAADVGTVAAAGVSAEAARADHVHDLSESVLRTVAGELSASLGVNSQKIVALGAPTADTDAATKAYVDAVAQGLAPKDSVRAATTAAGTLATDFENTDTIDGVALVTGDRILIKNQAAPAENGIYVVNAAGAPTRATDADSSGDLRGATVWVEEGTVNADTGWVLTTNAPITVGVTALDWTQNSGLGQITAGLGLTKTANTLDVGANADGSIVVNANDVQVGILATDAQHGVRGGGTQHAAATGAVAGFMSAADKTKLDGVGTAAPPGTRNLTAGAGLTGGGDLSADRTFDVGAGVGIDANANDVAVRESFLRQQVTDLTNAQILALRGTPIAVTPAAGGGKWIEFVSIQLIFNRVAGYTETADNLAVRYNNGTGAIVSAAIETTGFVDAAGDAITSAGPAATPPIVTAAGELSNGTLFLHNTGDGEFGGGDAGNSIRAIVTYRVHTTSL